MVNIVCFFYLSIFFCLSIFFYLYVCSFLSFLFRFVFLFLSACELMSKCLHSCYLFLLFLLFRASARSFKQRSLRVRGRKGLIFPLFLIGLVTSLTVLTFNKRQDCTHSYSTDLTWQNLFSVLVFLNTESLKIINHYFNRILNTWEKTADYSDNCWCTRNRLFLQTKCCACYLLGTSINLIFYQTLYKN